MSSEQKPVPAGYAPVNVETGFNRHVGPVWQAPDGSDYLFDICDIHLNGGATLHGGMAMALADIMMGRTVRNALGGARAMTVSLSCDLVGASKLGDRVRGVATITRRTRTIVFISCELSVEGSTILTATGIWKILANE